MPGARVAVPGDRHHRRLLPLLLQPRAPRARARAARSATRRYVCIADAFEPPSPPAPPNPAPPPRGTVGTVNFEDNLLPVGTLCYPFKEAMTFPGGVNAPTVPLLYYVDLASNAADDLCETGYAEHHREVESWYPAELLSPLPPTQGEGVTAEFNALADVGTDGVTRYYLQVWQPSLFLFCTAFYQDPTPLVRVGLRFHQRLPAGDSHSGLPFVPVCSAPSPSPPPSPLPHAPGVVVVALDLEAELSAADSDETYVCDLEPPPPPPPPPPPQTGALQALHLENDIPGHAGLNCEPFHQAVAFPEGVNAPTVPLIYLYDKDNGGGYYDCSSEFEDDPDGTGTWRLVELPGSVAPNAGPVAHGSFSAQLNAANNKHYLAFLHSEGFWCHAYYRIPSADTAAAFSYINDRWPAVGLSLYTYGVPTCAPPSPEPPPPPPPIGTLQALHLENDIPGHQNLVCEPYDVAITYNNGIDAPAVPLLYIYDEYADEADWDCLTSYDGNPDGTGAWIPVKLPSGDAISTPPIGSTVSFGAPLAYEGHNHLTIENREGMDCLVYYNKQASDAATAYSLSTANGPSLASRHVKCSSPTARRRPPARRPRRRRPPARRPRRRTPACSSLTTTSPRATRMWPTSCSTATASAKQPFARLRTGRWCSCETQRRPAEQRSATYSVSCPVRTTSATSRSRTRTRRRTGSASPTTGEEPPTFRLPTRKSTAPGPPLPRMAPRGFPTAGGPNRRRPRPRRCPCLHPRRRCPRRRRPRRRRPARRPRRRRLHRPVRRRRRRTLAAAAAAARGAVATNAPVPRRLLEFQHRARHGDVRQPRAAGR